MPSNRPFVPIEVSERARMRLNPNLADCSRIRDVWLQRQADNQNRDAGYSTSVSIGCLRELRAIAEDEAQCAIELLDQARKAIGAAAPLVQEYRDCIVESESRDGDLTTLPAEVKAEVETHDAAIARMKEVLAAIDAANQE